jgi:hypothetical protein
MRVSACVHACVHGAVGVRWHVVSVALPRHALLLARAHVNGTNHHQQPP